MGQGSTGLALGCTVLLGKVRLEQSGQLPSATLVPRDVTGAGEPFVSAGTCVMPTAGVGAPGGSVIRLMPKEPGKLLNLALFVVSFLLGK